MEWCLGMYSSGSTWLFNAVRKIAAAAYPNRPLVSNFVNNIHDIPKSDGSPKTILVKSHDTNDEAEAELSRHARMIWLSIRDPRDCVASLMQYSNVPFADAVERVQRSALFCERFVNHLRVSIFRYEDGFIENPATFNRIEQGLGVTLPVAERQTLRQAMQRGAIEHFIGQFDTLETAVRDTQSGALSDGVYDTVTHWHNHHANRSGKIGRWRRELSTDQVAVVETSLGDLMRRFGYRRRHAAARLWARLKLGDRH